MRDQSDKTSEKKVARELPLSTDTDVGQAKCLAKRNRPKPWTDELNLEFPKNYRWIASAILLFLALLYPTKWLLTDGIAEDEETQKTRVEEGGVQSADSLPIDVDGVGADPIASVQVAVQSKKEPAVPPEAEEDFYDNAVVTKGKQLFDVNCLACHQLDAIGKIGLAPSVGNRDFLALATDAFIRQTILNGRQGTAMAPRPDLSEKQVTAIITYLRSARVSNPVKVSVDWDKKFNGDATAGAVKYERYCSACHGEKGRGYVAGVPGTGIGLPGFLSAASDDYILQTLKLGRIGTPMRPFIGARGLANLTERDGHDLIAHLRELGRMNVPTRDKEVAVKGDPKRGKQHFDVNCVACHQSAGVGKVGFAPSVRNRDFLAIASDDFIRKTIRNGRLGTAMVPRPDLSYQAVSDIIAYLRSLPVSNPVEIVLDPTLSFDGNPTAGAVKYANFCAACHGSRGEGYMAGVPGPGIGLSGFLNSVSDDYILQTLRQGRIGTPMRPFLGAKGVANLTEEDAYDIIAQLRVMGKEAGSGQIKGTN